MPIIFAQSADASPAFIFGWLDGPRSRGGPTTGRSVGIGRSSNAEFQRQGFVYILCDIALIYFFCYFWTTVSSTRRRWPTSSATTAASSPATAPASGRPTTSRR